MQTSGYAQAAQWKQCSPAPSATITSTGDVVASGLVEGLGNSLDRVNDLAQDVEARLYRLADRLTGVIPEANGIGQPEAPANGTVEMVGRQIEGFRHRINRISETLSRLEAL